MTVSKELSLRVDLFSRIRVPFPWDFTLSTLTKKADCLVGVLSYNSICDHTSIYTTSNNYLNMSQPVRDTLVQYQPPV
jgi:hypothetical protein